jgi:hypothetical protein
MKVKRVIFGLIWLFLFASHLPAQMPMPKYSWSSEDTLKIAYKKTLVNESYKAQKLGWNKKRIIGTAAIITFGALAYYYHQQANESYLKYKKSGDLTKMNAYYRQTERYDMVKGISGVGIEIGFLLNIWSFF